MYCQLCSTLEKFQTPTALQESMHFHDTQLNESLNQSISRMCPKFKHFGASMTLSTRVHLVAIIRNIGYKACYNQLLQALQILPQSNKYFFEFIDKHDKVRRDQYARNVSAEYMRARKHKTKAKYENKCFYNEQMLIKELANQESV